VLNIRDTPYAENGKTINNKKCDSLFNKENNKKEKNIKTKIPMTNKRIKKF